MRPLYQSCHSYIRRPNVPADVLTPFYRDVIGLHIIRPVGEMVTFWAGEDLGFEIKCDDVDRGDHGDPGSAQCLPVFRSYDLTATRARLGAAGVTAVREDERIGGRIWVTGPDGHVMGFEQRADDSPFAADQEARRRWELGRPHLADLPPLPPDLQYMSRVMLHVHDVDRVSTFYRDVLGLDRVGTEANAAVHTLGDTVLMEIAPGGRVREMPSERIEVANVVMTRVHDLDDLLRDAIALGARQCGPTIEFFTGSRAAYLADPEGNIFGVQQRTLWGDYPEDLESDRRWKARIAGDRDVDGRL